MGMALELIYKQEGKPDRLVRFCCKGCEKDFNKDPAKYLKKIDDAGAAKSKDMGGMPM
jgi:transposase-like protein